MPLMVNRATGERRWVTWRERFRPIIAAVIAKHGLDDRSALKKALRAEWVGLMYGDQGWPYHCWCAEMHWQLYGSEAAADKRAAEVDARQLPLEGLR